MITVQQAINKYGIIREHVKTMIRELKIEEGVDFEYIPQLHRPIIKLSEIGIDKLVKYRKWRKEERRLTGY